MTDIGQIIIIGEPRSARRVAIIQSDSYHRQGGITMGDCITCSGHHPRWPGLAYDSIGLDEGQLQGVDALSITEQGSISAVAAE